MEDKRGTKNEIIKFLLDKDETVEWEIKKYRKKRSNTANSYYQVLKSKLAGALNIDNKKMHFDLITRYSECVVVPFLPNTDVSRIIPYYEYYKSAELNGKSADYYKIFVRSSEMDTKQFSRLLDGLISECEECGIETLTPEQLSRFEDYEQTY